MHASIDRFRLDMHGQLLMLVPLLFLLFPEHRVYAFCTYFSVRIWQTCSCYITAARGGGNESSGRSDYRRTLNWILSLTAIGICCAGLSNLTGLPGWLATLSWLGQGLLMMIMLFGSVLSPFLAIWYFTICMDDLKRLRQMRGRVAVTSQNNRNES